MLNLALALLQLAASEPVLFRGDAAHTGVYRSSTQPSLGNVKWKFRTGGKVISSPLVVGGTVYAGSGDHHLYALDANDGAPRWKFATKGAVHSSPGFANGMIYFGSLDGFFYAVEAGSGKLRWRFETEGERRFSAPGIHGATPRTERMPDPFDVFLSSPAIADGTVYFGSGDSHIYALDAATGSLRWKFKTGNVVHASPAVAGGVVYIGSWDRHLYALDAKSGSVIWKFETGDDREIYNQVGIASSAAIAEGTVFFGCRDGHFYALEQESGTLRWKHDNHKGWVIASPAVANRAVYFPTSDGTRFKALNAASGSLIFEIENKAVSFSSPAISGNRAYFGTSDGWLHAVDLQTGKITARFQTDGSKENSAKWIGPDGKMRGLYADTTLDAIIVGLDRMFSLGSILSSPTVANGVVYVGSTDGQIYALE